jgi:predicted RNA-binding Zn-ribbon protein involved in translation (DUF1610 family)
MARAICRCGQTLIVSGEGVVRVTCPSCGARVRIRLREDAPTTVPAPPPPSDDPYIRFYCPCGRRLKVRADDGLSHGKCPDCGRVVPVPPPPVSPAALRAARDAGDPETPTADLDPADAALRDRWCHEHLQAVVPPPGGTSTPVGLGSTASVQVSLPRARADHVESGLRICPGCGTPVHMQADICRHCGSAVPRR